MKNILIFAGVAGLASAVAIYLISGSLKSTGGTSRRKSNFVPEGSGYVTDSDIEAYNVSENTGAAQPV